jgi:hypothetical protein
VVAGRFQLRIAVMRDLRRVARREDFDRDFLEARACAREDVGETGTQRGESGAKRRRAGREGAGLGLGAERRKCDARRRLALDPSLACDIAAAVVAPGAEDDEGPLVGLLTGAVQVEQHFAREALGTGVVDAVLGGHGAFLFSRASLRCALACARWQFAVVRGAPRLSP